MAMKPRRMFGIPIDVCPSRDRAELYARSIWRSSGVVFCDSTYVKGLGPVWWFEII